MPFAQLALPVQHRPENKVLAVAIGILQLTLIVLAWLLALVPMALLALGVMTVKAMQLALHSSLPTANAP